jgi:hypothetical protein
MSGRKSGGGVEEVNIERVRVRMDAKKNAQPEESTNDLVFSHVLYNEAVHSTPPPLRRKRKETPYILKPLIALLFVGP